MTATIADAYLAHHAQFRPVDASFMGLARHDDRLPDASVGAADAERAGIAKLYALIGATPTEAEGLGERLDRRLATAQLRVTGAGLDHLPRFANPAWYTGEAAFAIIGLLLPSGLPTPRFAVQARLAALPDFLSDARARLAGAAAPAAVTARARAEATATARFLRDGLPLHPDYDPSWQGFAAAAAFALDAFAATLDGVADRPAAAGRNYIETLMREAHGFDFGADEAVRRAEAAFDDLGMQLVELAAQIDPSRSWEEQVAALAEIGPGSPDAVLELVRALDARAMDDGAALVTPARDYALAYRWLAPQWREVAGALYFLPYRSPPAFAAGGGSTYWIAPSGDDKVAYLRANSTINVKLIHAVHHGSIGHHTQNARARAAQSTLARVAGTDCALGLAFLSSGTMVEGWACYVQDLLDETPLFYSRAERLFLLQQQRRNAASVLVDIRLHTGEWTPEEAGAFYRDRAGFAPGRVAGEITRNVMLPGTRLMYWLGTEQILDLRRRWTGETRGFHDTLIRYGHIPVAWAGEEMARAGLLA
ncbi:DUF885 family protein [Sphingomonas ginsenosidivorax]|uniref:DUF885 family protein n=1 Tax=Sphingomonas ginsenosidivorax TaxID=862135 RepID=UPI0018F2E6FB|nr:DUF885 family protein [Sphingomonas ginsenosidivorax]